MCMLQLQWWLSLSLDLCRCLSLNGHLWCLIQKYCCMCVHLCTTCPVCAGISLLREHQLKRLRGVTQPWHTDKDQAAAHPGCCSPNCMALCVKWCCRSFNIYIGLCYDQHLICIIIYTYVATDACTIHPAQAKEVNARSSSRGREMHMTFTQWWYRLTNQTIVNTSNINFT